MKDLLFTAADMCSNDYKRRFAAEYLQLSIRHAKLSQMLERWDADELEFEPTCPRPLYDRQLTAMADYKSVLEARAKIEGIDLRKYEKIVEAYANDITQDARLYVSCKDYVAEAPHPDSEQWEQ